MAVKFYQLFANFTKVKPWKVEKLKEKVISIHIGRQIIGEKKAEKI